MKNNLNRTIRKLFLILIFAGPCFGQNSNPFTRAPNTDLSAVGIQQPTLPTATRNSSNTGNPANSVPSIADLKNVINKAMDTENQDKDWSTPVKLVIIFSGLAILPSLLVMMTSFTRIVIVLAFVRRALTTQTIPPNIAIMGLALFLTLYTMAPTFTKINDSAVQPYLADKIDFQTAGDIAGNCFKEFMLRQSRESDLALFVKMAKIEPPSSLMDIDMHIVIPAFIISEFRTAFEIGCLLFIPFLLIDMVIAGVLLSAGMMMLPPSMISLPFKLILFILVDGWGLLAKSISMSFN
ncbi:MAG: flagellar type III secretion system pore protein FliP [Sedimentisphaerales bacterium]|nr:flagellar type III secretion system pore protein FliP [Sedimentisphaerales bacterium]